MTVDLTANLAVIVAGIAALAGLLAPALRRMHRVERGVTEICGAGSSVNPPATGNQPGPG